MVDLTFFFKGVAWIYRILDSLHKQESMETWEGQKVEGNKQVYSIISDFPSG